MKNCKYAIAAALAAMIMLFGASCKESAADVRPTTATSSVTETATTEAATTAAQTTTEVTTADATTAATTVKTTAKATKANNVSDSDTIKKTSPAVKTTAKKTQATTKKKQQTTTKKQTSNKILYHYKDGTTGYTPQDGAWYIDPVAGDKCVYTDYSNIDSEGRDGIHCPQCGRVMGDGRNGTCERYICDAVCEYCGEHVKAMECHSCKK